MFIASLTAFFIKALLALENAAEAIAGAAAAPAPPVSPPTTKAATDPAIEGNTRPKPLPVWPSMSSRVLSSSLIKSSKD